MVIDRHSPRLPRTFPTGNNSLHISLEVAGREIGELPLGEITIERIERQWETPAVQHPTDLVLGETFRLIGYNLTPGEPLTLQLQWQSIAVSDTDYTVFVHALNSQGVLSAQSDSEPMNGNYPTSLWMQSEFIADSHTLTLPPGEYSLSLGMYLATTGERLLLRDGNDAVHIPAVIVP